MLWLRSVKPPFVTVPRLGLGTSIGLYVNHTSLPHGAAGDTDMGGEVTISCDALLAATRTMLAETARESQAPRPTRRDRVPPPAQPHGGHVTAEQCQWLEETVEDSMRWLLNHRQEKINEDNAFPRIWCGCRVC